MCCDDCESWWCFDVDWVLLVVVYLLGDVLCE